MSHTGAVYIQVLELRSKILVTLLLVLGAFFAVRMMMSPGLEQFDIWLRGGLWLLIILVWSSWIFRAYGNLEKVFGLTTKRSPLMAVLVHFIPLVHLFKPYQVFREIWQKSAPLERRHERVLLGVWWGVWVLCPFYYAWNRALFQAFPYAFVDTLLTCLDVALFPLSCVLAARVIWTITAFQASQSQG